MGKATKRKQEAQQARMPDFNGLFLKSKEVEAKKQADIASFNPLKIIEGYESQAIRSLEDFEPRTRSLNTSTRGRELVRYAFNKYNPPAFLYNVWDSQPQKDQYKYLFGIPEDFRLWYLALSQGRSLYKECSMGLLTKRETFYVSTCPYPFTIPEAIWYSVIRCMDEDAPAALARKIASTKISGHKIDDFWKGVARWFMKNNTSIRQMNDLLDYVANRHQENGEWYLKDQTLAGLQKAMQSWHRELYRTRTMCRQYEKWEGIKTPDCQMETDGKSANGKRKKIHWRFHQIKTGKELSEEGNKMHHCVSSYGASCHSGRVSIWSLTSDDQGFVTRALTIEISGGSIVQARGYANRPARPDELRVLRDWAAKCNFSIRST